MSRAWFTLTPWFELKFYDRREDGMNIKNSWSTTCTKKLEKTAQSIQIYLENMWKMSKPLECVLRTTTLAKKRLFEGWLNTIFIIALTCFYWLTLNPEINEIGNRAYSPGRLLALISSLLPTLPHFCSLSFSVSLKSCISGYKSLSHIESERFGFSVAIVYPSIHNIYWWWMLASMRRLRLNAKYFHILSAKESLIHCTYSIKELLRQWDLEWRPQLSHGCVWKNPENIIFGKHKALSY